MATTGDFDAAIPPGGKRIASTPAPLAPPLRLDERRVEAALTATTLALVVVSAPAEPLGLPPGVHPASDIILVLIASVCGASLPMPLGVIDKRAVGSRSAPTGSACCARRVAGPDPPAPDADSFIETHRQLLPTEVP